LGSTQISFNAKIKAFRAQHRGVRDINFFLFRITHLFAWPPGFGFDPKELLKAIPE
jgi:hypothetical protein